MITYYGCDNGYSNPMYNVHKPWVHIYTATYDIQQNMVTSLVLLFSWFLASTFLLCLHIVEDPGDLSGDFLIRQ